MNSSWAVRLPAADAIAARSLRPWKQVEVRASEAEIWLRGADLDDALDLALRKLPGAVRYGVSQDGQLTPLGARVPSGRLPHDDWRPLVEWIVLEPQPAQFAGVVDRRIALRLATTDEVREPNGLVTNWAHWAEYAAGAPEVRLRPLVFAASADARVFLRGHPLPPLSGERLVERDRIAVPCGLAFSPPVDATVLHELLRFGPDAVALFARDGSFERIAGGQFVRATRSAVRETATEGMP